MLCHDNLAIINILLEYFRFTQSGGYGRRIFRKVYHLQNANTALPTSSHHKPCTPIRWKHICSPAPLLKSCSGWDHASLLPDPPDMDFLITLQLKNPPETYHGHSFLCCCVSKSVGPWRSPAVKTTATLSLASSSSPDCRSPGVSKRAKTGLSQISHPPPEGSGRSRTAEGDGSRTQLRENVRRSLAPGNFRKRISSLSAIKEHEWDWSEEWGELCIFCILLHFTTVASLTPTAHSCKVI